MSASPLVLASTSPYRRELLARLGLPFEAVAPLYDEPPLPGLPPAAVALRHAEAKAREVSARLPGRIVIGSDQTADLDGEILGKPGNEVGAAAQLRRMAGRAVVFHTGLAVAVDGRCETVREDFTVRLRPLDEEQILDYVRRERPFGCAGSFRIEGLGIALMERLEGRDFTALIGLPLIALTDLLARFGITVLGEGRLRLSP